MKLDPSGIDAIIFDFGGVLFAIDYLAPVREFEKLGFGNFQDIYNQSLQNKVFDELETGKISNDDFLRYLNSLCPGVSPKEILNAWNSILIGLMHEQADFVATLQEKGYRTFILSNTNAIHVDVFEKMIDDEYGLDKFTSYFEHVVYSNVLGMKKPYPETFAEVCRKYSLSPEHTLFIDDSAQHVEGAEKAGLIGHHLEPGETISQLLTKF